MISTGLVSISFRKLEPQQVIKLVSAAKLDGIEWGGDIHAPHGNLSRAREVYQMTMDAGLKVLAYGSYYHVGEKEEFTFEDVLGSAAELHAGIIRVWAGKRPSAEADDAYLRKAVEDSRRIGDMAAQHDMIIAYECHGGTLTDSVESTVGLLQEVAHPRIKSYWQQPLGLDSNACLASLKSVLPWLVHVHAYHWEKDATRHLLAEGAQAWKHYLPVIDSTGRDHAVMLEFVKDDSPDIFLEDAATLRSWIN